VLDIALGPYLETISIYSLEIKLHSADNNETFFFGGPDKRDSSIYILYRDTSSI